MDETTTREYCRKCGMETFPFSRKFSASANEYFCVKCAEKTDKEYLIKHSCSVCKRLLKSQEVKLVMPSKLYVEGSAKLPLVDRLVCTACYKRVASRDVDRRSFKQKVGRIRMNIRNGFVRQAIKETQF